ncbi:NUDIX hydrolase [Streptomyces coeruleoprunus]|uniref:NUDIX hydrolase n=1 Tax=Streptomyces coeruleoprunus TaxID=285563 RepID=A0ABV9XJI5_9ACTN
MTGADVVRAAGCVLWRGAPGGALEICLVHRPKYDDWSHPKGKLKRGEEALAGAVREVLEETGRHCVPGAPLPTVRYVAKGRQKEVRYWSAEAQGGTFTPTDEVDKIAWLPPDEALTHLTHPQDQALLRTFLTR